MQALTTPHFWPCFGYFPTLNKADAHAYLEPIVFFKISLLYGHLH